MHTCTSPRKSEERVRLLSGGEPPANIFLPHVIQWYPPHPIESLWGSRAWGIGQGAEHSRMETAISVGGVGLVGKVWLRRFSDLLTNCPEKFATSDRVAN